MSQAWFEFHGLRVELQSESCEITQIFTDRLNQHVSKPSPKADIQLRVAPLASTRLPKPTEIRSELHWIRSIPFHGDYSSSQFLLTDGFSVACSDFKTATVSYGIDPRSPRDPNSFIRTFLWLPLLAALHTHGLLYLHASFIRISNRGLLFLEQVGAENPRWPRRYLRPAERS